MEETHFEPGNCLHSSIPLIWLFRSGFNAMAAHVNPIKPLVAIPKDPARSSFTVVTPEIWAHRDVPMDEDDGFVHVCFSSSSHWEGSSGFLKKRPCAQSRDCNKRQCDFDKHAVDCFRYCCAWLFFIRPFPFFHLFLLCLTCFCSHLWGEYNPGNCMGFDQ